MKKLSSTGNKKFYLTLTFIKVFYLFFAVFVYAKLTVLGDTERYLSGGIGSVGEILTSSTAMMDAFAGISGSVLGGTFGNVPFLLLALFGICYPCSKFSLSLRDKFLICALCALPSFGVWTSVASKEAMCVFSLGILLAGYIELDQKRPISSKLLFCLGLYLTALFKIHYLAPIVCLFAYLFIKKFTFRYPNFRLLQLFFGLALIGLILFLIRGQADEIANMVPAHFNPTAGSSRENTIWIKPGDYYRNAFYGMYLGFWGVTFAEAKSSPVYLIIWIESLILFSLFVFFLIRYFLLPLLNFNLNIKILWILIFVVSGFLFVHYPFGVLNIGSSVRYKQGFIIFLVILIFYTKNSTRNNFRNFNITASQ